MNRRTAIRHVIVIGAGAALLASCQDKSSLASRNVPLTGSQEDLLSTLTETIIPTTDFIGSKDLGAQKFIVVMVDDCASPDDQKKFMTGMQKFDELCKRQYNTRFVKCDPKQREEFLLTVEAKTDIPAEVVEFYSAIKQLTIQSFTTSEEYLMKVKNFSLLPGKFKGCVPVAAV
jgi:hypothetical protein